MICIINMILVEYVRFKHECTREESGYFDGARQTDVDIHVPGQCSTCQRQAVINEANDKPTNENGDVFSSRCKRNVVIRFEHGYNNYKIRLQHVHISPVN